MNNEEVDKRTKIREQIGILLLVVVLCGSGYLLLSSESGKDEIKFIPGSSQTVSANATTPAKEAASTTSSVSAKININVASLEDLDKITGVGPATAQKIIDYREQNGNFKTIDEIKEVSGIGDAKYEKMKNEISI